MVTATQRTIYQIDLSIAREFEQPYTILANTTLNEKFNTNVTTAGVLSEYPTTDYFHIGVGGNVIYLDDGGYKVSTHSPLDGSLFSPIPFVMRTVDNDLGIADQESYGMRVEEVVGGVSYYSYYFKRISGISYRSDIQNINTSDNLSTLSVVNTNTAEILSPVPRQRDALLNMESNSYIVKTCKLGLTLSVNDIVELRNVMTIKLGEIVNVTELAICSGITTENVGGWNDVKSSQIMYHIAIGGNDTLDFNQSIANGTAIEKVIEIGGMEQLMV